MKVKNYQQAWEIVFKIMPGNYEKNSCASARAGYDIYISDDDAGNWVSDLGDRLEVNFNDGRTVNVWIESVKPFAESEIGAAICEINDAIYSIEDNITPRLMHATRIENALAALRGAIEDLTGILRDDYPASVLFEIYHLDEV